ncbi:ABC transporter ATP-binding protein [Hwanghaeella grinnelliae]|uniref:ABC transporter ATP-binding protein n=1 Tax=Hwanghaeella grinnelliae TaxID=2500179 RepID=A0A3S2VKG9_9PROT|nr:ABC transporter ATP-binding protein [Hwanghaeella grinnelliae]RVU33997.1 ABC transporter ATP-binding protein [Hwanghaeella grinnelliae]
MATVDFNRIWKRYGDVEAVKDVSLNCPQGEMLALLGPSGCGKSSILKMVAGVEEISEGEITFDAKPVSHLPPGARNIAMVFEDYALYPHMTAAENIAFPLKVRGVPRREAAKRIDGLIDMLSLDDVRDQRVSGLSGGAQQRISIGRALVRDPELVLFDEPLSHLDGDQKVQLRSEIKRLQQTANLTSILVTHDQSEAIAMADRVAVMNNGVLQQVGSPHDLYETPANLFVANFIGEPPMNLYEVTVHQTGNRIILRHDGLAIDFAADVLGRFVSGLGSDAATIGIRPEDVRVSAGHGQTYATDGDAAATIPARVDYIEPRGDSDVLTLKTDSGAIVVAEVDGPSEYVIGSPTEISVSVGKVHFFSTETGNALGRRGGDA